jgi:hypothetical protein
MVLKEGKRGREKRRRTGSRVLTSVFGRLESSRGWFGRFGAEPDKTLRENAIMTDEPGRRAKDD